MIDSESPSEERTVPNPWVRWLVVGLPFGLLFMGALSFVFYFHKRNAPREAQPSRYSSMMRKDLNLEEYKRYLEVLARIGPRTPAQPGNVEAVESYIQSTMGYDNMGYDLVRRDVGKSVAFEAALPASQSARHLVLVCARYDGNSAESLAALFSLAHAMTGSSHRNGVRFFVFSKEVVPPMDPGALISYQEWNPKENFDQISTFYLADGATPLPSKDSVAILQAPAANDPAALETLRKYQEVIESAGDASAK